MVERAATAAARQRQQVAAPRAVEVGRQLGEPYVLGGHGHAGGLERLHGRGELALALAQGPARGLELLPRDGEPLVAFRQRVPGGLELLPLLGQPLVLLVEPPVSFPEGLAGGLQRVGHADQLAGQDAALPARLLARRQRAAEGGCRRVERRPDAVELAAVGLVGLAPRPALEDAEAAAYPVGDVRVRQQRVVAAAVVAQVGREEGLDVGGRRGAVAARQRQAELPADPVERRGRVRQQIVVAHVGARHAARVGLRVEDVAQPDEVGHERVDPVAGLQRGGDVERAADGGRRRTAARRASPARRSRTAAAGRCADP